jgi:hypothetical protein
MKKLTSIIITLLLSCNIQANENIKPENEFIKAFSKEEYIQFTESFVFCQQFNLIYRTDFNSNIEKGNKGFVNSVIQNDYSKYYVCNILSLELMEPVFTWQKDNNSLYVKSYMKGLCNLSINLDYMKEEEDKFFVEKTKEYFLGRVVNFHKLYPEIAKEYNIDLILDKNNLDKSLKDSCKEFN